MKIFAVNPGSTSTKTALFEDGKVSFSSNIVHQAAELAQFEEIPDQFPYRKEAILKELETAGISLEGTDAFAGRCGGLMSLAGGTYAINDIMLKHARSGITLRHPATLGPLLAHDFALTYGGKAFVVNPTDVDELCDQARMTGLKGVFRESRTHALNQKEVCIRYAAEHGTSYRDINLITCHIGGGVSVTAHQKGRMVDTTDAAHGNGPMGSTRCGDIPVRNIIDMCFSGAYSKREIQDKQSKTGGLVDHLGTSDGLEVMHMIEQGDEYARLVYETMIYQIAKTAAAMAAVLYGQVDGIILTGGMAHNEHLVGELKRRLSFIAPITVMAGEFEMEALASGAARVLSGQETARTYSGIPVWQGFMDKIMSSPHMQKAQN